MELDGRLGARARAVAMRQPFGGELLTAVIDRQRAVQVRVDVDASAGIAAAAGPGAELQQAAVELEGVVVSHGPPILEAADAFELIRGRRWSPCRLGVGGPMSEARIKSREKPIEHALCLGERARLREPQFDHEAVLEGAKEAFDATSAFRRRGGDPADAEFLEGAANLSRFGRSVELLGEGPRRAGIAMKDSMPIGVRSRGHPIAADEAAEQAEVPLRLFPGAKDAGEDLSRGIVNGRVEHEPGPAVLEPRVVAAVHLDKEAGLGHALPSATMAGWAARAGTADTGCAQQTLHRLPRNAEGLALGQQLGEMMIVHAGVGGPCQSQDPGTDRLSDAARGRTPAIAMGEGARAVLAEAGEQPAEVTERESQEASGFPGAQGSVMNAREDMQSLMLPLGQGDRLPGHGMTYSLTR